MSGFTMDNENEKKKGGFLTFIIIFLLLVSFFAAGSFFGNWGGHERLIPLLINSIRNGVLGDENILILEKKVFSMQDEMKRKNIENIEKITYRETTVYNENILKLKEDYLTNYHEFNKTDIELLKVLIENYTPNITPVYPDRIKGEGIWQQEVISPKTFKPLVAKTFLRTDINRPFVKVFVHKYDLDHIQIEFIPGKNDADHKLCDGRMSPDQRERVMWIFSGGFQYRHGHYGMKYKNQVVLPPKRGAMTFFIYKDGTYKIGEWTKETEDNEDIIAYRQNELPLIVDGEITDNLNRLWGLTPHDVDPIYTVRSGMGLTANNELVFAYGEHLSAETLAIGMQKAGVVNGMHLDMNYFNVHLVNVKRDEKGRLLTFNENEILSYYRNIYSVLNERDYFLLTNKK